MRPVFSFFRSHPYLGRTGDAGRIAHSGGDAGTESLMATFPEILQNQRFGR